MHRLKLNHSEVDRGRLDPANFTAVVMDHNEETGLCTLGTTVGTLDTQFSRNQFELLPQKFVSTADVPENVTVGVREAARLHSNTGGQGFFKCSCQTKCETKKCKCRKDGVRCNSRCHKNRSCRNHDNDLIWINIAFDMYFHFHLIAVQQSSWVLQLAALMVFKIKHSSLSLLSEMASCRSATFTFYEIKPSRKRKWVRISWKHMFLEWTCCRKNWSFHARITIEASILPLLFSPLADFHFEIAHRMPHSGVKSFQLFEGNDWVGLPTMNLNEWWW